MSLRQESSHVFVDSCFFIAVLNPKDDLHAIAKQAEEDLKHPRFVTTDFVLVEVLSYFARQASEARSAAARLVKKVMDRPDFEVVPTTREWFMRGFDLFEARPDKEYSLVDCVSFEVMRRRGIQRALTGDHHFEQEGFERLLR